MAAKSAQAMSVVDRHDVGGRDGDELGVGAVAVPGQAAHERDDCGARRQAAVGVLLDHPDALDPNTGIPNDQTPARMYVSAWLSPKARTRMRTSPEPGVGSGSSRVSRTSGPP